MYNYFNLEFPFDGIVEKQTAGHDKNVHQNHAFQSHVHGAKKIDQSS